MRLGKRYLVFSGMQVPAGGCLDLVGSYSSLSVAIRKAKSSWSFVRWWHVLDTRTWKVVAYCDLDHDSFDYALLSKDAVNHTPQDAFE